MSGKDPERGQWVAVTGSQNQDREEAMAGLRQPCLHLQRESCISRRLLAKEPLEKEVGS